MRDIARETGLSQSTVSRVLNRRPTIIPIGEETRERVLATAQTLGYRPNPLARGLRGSSTMLLGLIVREITDPFFAGAIETVTSAAARRGYNVVLGHAHARAEEAITLWGVLEARHCDAILLLGDMRDQPRLLHDLSGEHVPVVGLWHGAHTTQLPCVAVDNYAGVRDVLDHLRGLGHRQIGFVGGRQLGDITERGEAFVQYHEDAGQPLDTDYLQLGLPDASGAIGALKLLLELPEPATAVVAATDVLAIGLLHAADLLGLRVPEQLSITGFDDIPMAMFTVPALTTMRMPVSEMVDQALRLALDDVGDSDQAVPVLKASLVVRSSTGPPGRESVPPS